VAFKQLKIVKVTNSIAINYLEISKKYMSELA